MTADALLHAISDIPDGFVTEYAQYKAKPRLRTVIRRVGAIAACIALVVCVLFLNRAQTTDPYCSGKTYSFASYNELSGILPQGHLLHSLPTDSYSFSDLKGFFRVEGNDSGNFRHYRYLDLTVTHDGAWGIALWCTFDYWDTLEHQVNTMSTSSVKEKNFSVTVGDHEVFFVCSYFGEEPGYQYNAYFADGTDLYALSSPTDDPRAILDFLAAWLEA